MSDIIFGIPCRYSNDKSYIFDCVSSLRKYHPDVDILVIDSCSNDTSYLDRLYNEFGVIRDDYRNPNYIDGVIWHTYKNYNRKKYCFIHDNLIINRNIMVDIEPDLTVYSYFRSCFKPNANVSAPIIGLEDSIESLEWLYDNLQKIHLNSVEIFDGIFGPMFNVDKNILDKIYAMGWSDVFLPKNKPQAGQMERIWGMVMTYLGFDIKTNCLIGDYQDKHINRAGHKMENNGIIKYYGGRS